MTQAHPLQWPRHAPRTIQKGAAAFHETHGRWPRVFCSSLSDVFDNAVDPAWRAEAFAAISKPKAIAMVAALALSGCVTPASVAPSGKVHTITHDGGGSAELRQRHIDGLRQSGDRIVIDGLCASACTMYLGLPDWQVCATRRSVFAFHAATRQINGAIDYWWTFRELRAAYHPGLWAWFEVNAAHLQSKNFATLTGAEMIANGYVREC